MCAGAGRRLLLVILLIAAGLCADNATCRSARADDLRSGIAAYDRGDYATAFRILKPLAEAGDKYAQSHLGAMYLHGMGVEKNYAEALKWNRKAAEAGLAGAQHMLGQMYWVGLGVPKDYDEAAKWYQKAAEQGQAEGQFALAYMYQHGQSVPRDPSKAVELYRKAEGRTSPRILCRLTSGSISRWRSCRRATFATMRRERSGSSMVSYPLRKQARQSG